MFAAAHRAAPATQVRTPTQPELDDVQVRRPAPRARSMDEIRSSVAAIVALVRSGDPRLAALGKGGYFAATWVGGQTDRSPATGAELPRPNLAEVAAEIESAGRSAAGVQAFPDAIASDEARIAARGVEEWLAWCFVNGYPTPIWLRPGADLAEVGEQVIGAVGAGRPGLLGPGFSSETFPYDVADVLDAGQGQ